MSSDKSKQTSTFLEIPNSNESSFEMGESSFEHLLSYLNISINGLLEMWGGLLNFYFRNQKGSQKIFFGSSLDEH